MMAKLTRETIKQATKTNKSSYNKIQRQMGEALPNGPNRTRKLPVSIHNQRQDTMAAIDSPRGS